MNVKHWAFAATLAAVLAACEIKKSETTNTQSNSSEIRSAKPSNFRFPAEWERHESIWMAWPTYENRAGFPTQDVQKQMIRALEGHVKVEMLVQDAADEAAARAELGKDKIKTDNVHFRQVPHNDIWMRDMGPMFLKTDDDKLKIADFNFNVWGYESPDSEGSKKEEQVDRLVAQEFNLNTLKSQMISEGGALEFNGKGTMIAVEAVATMRNPTMSLLAIENEYKRMFNVTKVIWLKEGVAEDDSTLRGYLPGHLLPLLTTNGHSDEFVRFVDSNVILLAQVSKEDAAHDPIAAITAKRMQDAFRILSNATDQDGNPFRIVPMPVPDNLEIEMKPEDGVFQYIATLTFLDGSKIDPNKSFKAILPTSYLNFLITNDLVLAPQYWKEGRPSSTKQKDELVASILRRELPSRTIVPINPENINAGGGGMHCITQQQPAL